MLFRKSRKCPRNKNKLEKMDGFGHFCQLFTYVSFSMDSGKFKIINLQIATEFMADLSLSHNK